MCCCLSPVSIRACNLPKTLFSKFISVTLASAATGPPVSRLAGGGCNYKRGGGAPERSLPCFNHYLQTLLSITCHGPTCPNRRKRLNWIKILLMWLLGLALTTSVSLFPPKFRRTLFSIFLSAPKFAEQGIEVGTIW
jgi:hypothetical protein